jgi:hypothetical protein
MKYVLGACIALALVVSSALHAQVAGEPAGSGGSRSPEPETTPADTLFVFEPARPLIDSQSVTKEYEDTYGFDLLFSNSGFGVGGFYQHNYTENLAAFINLGGTGSRNSDEFDEYDYDVQDYRVPGKVNRLYTFPLTVGLRYRLLNDVLVDNFRPYFNFGVGPSLIVALPYQYSFFKSFGHASAYFTGGGFVGVGAEVGGKKPILGVNVRYFYIPFKPGIESIRDQPITDFGGLFLTLNVGFH